MGAAFTTNWKSNSYQWPSLTMDSCAQMIEEDRLNVVSEINFTHK